MVTITAPGVEINELDLSFYDFPLPKEETQNVFITGFATQGYTCTPYTFTNKNSDDDLINTFGVPTNEAERYFFNACSEAIKRPKVVLYAVRLPYFNDSTKNYNCVKYTLDETAYPVRNIGENDPLSVIADADHTLDDTYYAKLNSGTYVQLAAEEIENYRKSIKKPASNSFMIVDKNQEIYKKIPQDAEHMELSSRYMLGVLPVVTTATNALYYQKLINTAESSLTAFEPTNNIKTTNDNITIEPKLLVYPASSNGLDEGNKDALTISKFAMGYFPTINIQPDGSFARDRLNNIGVVVFKSYIDAESGNKIAYEPVEAFAGSLKNTDVDPTTGVSRFIDDIINTNSKTIEFYSNCFNGKFKDSSLQTQVLTVESPESDIKTTTKLSTKKIMKSSSGASTVDPDKISFIHINGVASIALGFNEIAAADKSISYGLIMSSLDKIFEKNKDRNAKQIDIVVDAGIGNIADFMYQVNGSIDVATESSSDSVWLSCYDPLAYKEYDENKSKSAVALWDVCSSRYDGIAASVPKDYAMKQWTIVQKKYDAFCKLRGDCMFIADGLRPLCVCGNRKRVTPRNFKTTVANTITPFMKYMTGKIDTSYGCGNCDWYQITDPTSGINMWMPPSVKMMCSMLDTTNAKYYWTVPVGVNNGKMNPVDNPSKVKVIDIAFSPTVQDAGDIYTKSWNYATYYEDDGFCLEGQRTFQTRPTAFDRINVRRLFLYLERKTYNAAKYFIYQGNTAYTRQRLVDAITPFFEDAKINEGLYDYRIVCDESNNTPDTIDRNELHVKIAIKPTKAIEFIECTFVALRTGGSFTEVGIND